MKTQFKLGDSIDTNKIKQVESEREHVWDIERGDKTLECSACGVLESDYEARVLPCPGKLLKGSLICAECARCVETLDEDEVCDTCRKK